MPELKEEIFTELAILEEYVAKLRGTSDFVKKQTDLEVAILTKQLSDQRAKNKTAQKYIDEATGLLKTFGEEPSPRLTAHPSKGGEL